MGTFSQDSTLCLRQIVHGPSSRQTVPSGGGGCSVAGSTTGPSGVAAAIADVLTASRTLATAAQIAMRSAPFTPRRARSLGWLTIMLAPFSGLGAPVVGEDQAEV